MDTLTLLAANTIVLCVMAVAFLAAWLGRWNEAYWPSWILSNVALAAALAIFMYVDLLPPVPAALAAHSLLLLGLGLRWRAARLFSGRPAGLLPVAGPMAAFLLLCIIPGFLAPSVFFTLVNVMLALQSAAVAHEFWRDREDRLPSRYGLVFAYAAMAASFAARIVQGSFFFGGAESYLPQDMMLQAHLVVALFMTSATGAFILSIAYERSGATLREAAMRDALTGLYNRRAFEDRVRAYLAGTESEPFALVLFDVDHFKRINDRYGHLAGDAALRACAKLCAGSVRRSDIVARIGGEEFAALLPDISPADAYEVTDRVRRAVGEATIACGEHRISLTLSAGICHGTVGEARFDALMRDADERLYLAKNAGRDRVEHTAPDLAHAAAAV